MDREAKLKRIYEAAIKIFSVYGYKKTTIEDIASELGWTKGALYKYVEGKEDLYSKSVCYLLKIWQQKAIDAANNTQDILRKFEVMCEMALGQLVSDERLKRLLILDPEIFPLTFKEDPYKEINNQSRGFLKSILDEGVKEGRFRITDTELLSNVLFSIYKALILETCTVSEEDATRVFEMAIELVTKGFYN